MAVRTKNLTLTERDRIFALSEDGYTDFKVIAIKPSSLTKPLSAFANTDGGSLYIGIEEHKISKVKSWKGFSAPEDANGHLQAMERFFPMGRYFSYAFLECPAESGIVLRVKIRKTPDEF